MQNFEYSDGSEEIMETPDAVVQSQHDCMAKKYAKKHISKHSRVYISYQMGLGSEAFKRAL